MAIRVMLVDGQPLFLEGMAASLGRDGRFSVVARHTDLGEALKAAPAAKPDVVVMDVNAPVVRGLVTGTAVIGKLREACAARVVVLTTISDEDVLRHCFARGAAAYLLKDIDGPGLVETVLAVARGKVIVSSGIDVRALTRGKSRARARPEPADHGLTRREKEVLAMVAAGASSREISRDLGISARTVETHRLRLMRKMQVGNAAGLVSKAALHGLLGS